LIELSLTPSQVIYFMFRHFRYIQIASLILPIYMIACEYDEN